MPAHTHTLQTPLHTTDTHHTLQTHTTHYTHAHAHTLHTYHVFFLYTLSPVSCNDTAYITQVRYKDVMSYFHHHRLVYKILLYCPTPISFLTEEVHCIQCTYICYNLSLAVIFTVMLKKGTSTYVLSRYYGVCKYA